MNPYVEESPFIVGNDDSVVWLNDTDPFVEEDLRIT